MYFFDLYEDGDQYDQSEDFKSNGHLLRVEYIEYQSKTKKFFDKKGWKKMRKMQARIRNRIFRSDFGSCNSKGNGSLF
jgi:hypothetical protein